MRSRASITILAIVVVLLAMAGGWWLGKSSERRVLERDTMTVIDTVTYAQPVAKDSTVVRYVTRHLPVVKHTDLAGNYAQKDGENIPPQGLSDDRDSMAVEIPITQKRYESDDYSAWVSGYEPCLDSIRVYPKTTVIRERERKPPNRWHIGVTGGYGWGFGSKQAEPFVGVGIMWSILSF